jgi:hypothetical protein
MTPAGAWRTTLWLGWLAWAVWITAGPFRRLVEAFRNPGPEYYRLLFWTLPIFAGVVGLYLWLRRANLWRYEPAIVAGVCAGAFLFYRFAATLLLAGLFLACYAAGAWLRERLALHHPGPPESELPVSTALGIAMLGPVLFLLGLLHLYYWWISTAALAIPCILLRRYWMAVAGSLREMWDRWKQTEELRNPLAGLAVVYIAIAATASSVVILAPSLAFDAIHMHLREAFFYAESARAGASARPQLLLLPRRLRGADLHHGRNGRASRRAIAVGDVFRFDSIARNSLAREAGSTRSATLTGIAAIVTMPVFHWTASVAKNDLMMVLFELAALECFLCWRRDGAFRWILAGAFLLASAFDVKHVALFGAVPLGCSYLPCGANLQRRPPLPSWRWSWSWPEPTGMRARSS